MNNTALEELIESFEEGEETRLNWMHETIPGNEEENIPPRANLVMVYSGNPVQCATIKALITSILM